MSNQIQTHFFESQVRLFNNLYQLPVASYPTVTMVVKYEAAPIRNQTLKPILSNDKALLARLTSFKKVISDEVSEIDDIIETFNKGDYAGEAEFLTDMADWLGDLIVYCTSEMLRYGIPIDETLNIIMQSNFSKLGEDGKPIISGGKVQKGPRYWKPEPALLKMLGQKIQEGIDRG